MNVIQRTAANLDELARQAAGLVMECAVEAVKHRGRFTLVLAGGGTPRNLYETLSRPPYKDRIPWEHCFLFWGDERCVPLDDPESNYRMARESLLRHVPLRPRQVFPMPVEENNPEAAAQEYEDLLRRQFPETSSDSTTAHGGGEFPRFDLVLLGMGEDGHTASLFPGSPVLDERARWVSAAGAPATYPTRNRLTLTLPVLNAAACVAFLAAGAGKRGMVGRVFGTPAEGDPDLPASLVRPVTGRLVWFLDQAATPPFRVKLTK